MRKYISAALILILLVIVGNSVLGQRIMVTIAGTGVGSFGGDGGWSKTALLKQPNDVCQDAAQNLYIADRDNNRIRKISPTKGIITTIGGGGSSSIADGIPATNASLTPNYMCIDAVGNLYITTGDIIRKINTVTGIITTIAGTVTAGFSGDGGLAIAARLNDPEGICVDTSNNIYFVDNGNYRVRKITASTGIISTIAGNGTMGYTGDGGTATAATMNNTHPIGVNVFGDIFFSDQGGQHIRKIDPVTGIITNYAGIGGDPANASGGPATSTCLGEIFGIHVCRNGDLYLDDQSCSSTRIDFASGNIYLEAGSLSISGYTGNGRNALTELFQAPAGLWVDSTGSIIIADVNNNRIRKAIKVTSMPKFAYGRGQSIMLCTSHAYSIDSLMAITDLDSPQIETWTVLSPPLHGTLTGFPATGTCLGSHSIVTPVGSSYAPALSYVGQDSFRVRVTDGAFSDTVNVYVSVQTVFLDGISGVDHLCAGVNSLLYAPALGGVWSVSNSHLAVAFADSTVMGITGLTPGLDTITYVVSGVCPIIATKILTVNALPSAGRIISPTNICLGATTIATETAPGGVWSTSFLYYMTIDSLTGMITTVSPGTAIIRYTVNDTLLCSSSTTASITINSPPPPGTISGPAAICVGAAMTFADPVAGGIWSASNSNATIGISGIVIGTTAGTDSIIYTVTSIVGCSASAAELITISSFPDAGTITGSGGVCIGSVVTLTDVVGGGVWGVSNPNATISSTGVVSGMLPGSDSVLYSVSNVCGTAATASLIMINPIPDAGTISGHDSVCVGLLITLSDASSGGIWSANNSYSSVSVTGIVTGLSVGIDTILYSVSNSCGIATTSQEITVNDCYTLGSHTPLPTPITIFPNPATSVLNIEGTALQQGASIAIADVSGRVVLRTELTGNGQVDVSSLKDGVYMIAITSGADHFTDKLVVSK